MAAAAAEEPEEHVTLRNLVVIAANLASTVDRLPVPFRGTMPVALASQLREGTKKAHTMAENTGFVSCFLKGVVDKVSYRTLVADLWFVYSAMEDEIGRLADHPVVGPIHAPALNRRESLEQDLAFYFGGDWRNLIRATPGVRGPPPPSGERVA